MTSAKSRKIPAPESQQPSIDPFRGQHMAVAQRQIATEHGHASVTIDEAESPLAWLARRRGRDGRPLIEPHQLQAGERLRADFTRANLMPRTTSNWESPISSDRRSGGDHRLFFPTVKHHARNSQDQHSCRGHPPTGR